MLAGIDALRAPSRCCVGSPEPRFGSDDGIDHHIDAAFAVTCTAYKRKKPEIEQWLPDSANAARNASTVERARAFSPAHRARSRTLVSSSSKSSRKNPPVRTQPQGCCNPDNADALSRAQPGVDGARTLCRTCRSDTDRWASQVPPTRQRGIRGFQTDRSARMRGRLDGKTRIARCPRGRTASDSAACAPLRCEAQSVKFRRVGPGSPQEQVYCDLLLRKTSRPEIHEGLRAARTREGLQDDCHEYCNISGAVFQPGGVEHDVLA